MKKLRVLVACEFSGIVREEFRKRGHDAWSCDLLPTEIPGQHIQDDVRNHLEEGWGLMIAFPPCTYLANSGVQYLHKNKERWKLMNEARDFFLLLLNAPINKICIENPVPHHYAELPKYTQIIQPYWFGNPIQKRTCLWLKNLPLLTPTHLLISKGKPYIGKNGEPNGSEWYQLLTPGKDRWKNRSRTFQGMAEAMATQWS